MAKEVHMAEILSMADWSRDSTFKAFYYKNKALHAFWAALSKHRSIFLRHFTTQSFLTPGNASKKDSPRGAPTLGNLKRAPSDLYILCCRSSSEVWLSDTKAINRMKVPLK